MMEIICDGLRLTQDGRLRQPKMTVILLDIGDDDLLDIGDSDFLLCAVTSLIIVSFDTDIQQVVAFDTEIS